MKATRPSDRTHARMSTRYDEALDFDHALFDALYAGRPAGAAYFVMVALSAIGGGWASLALVPLLARPSTRPFARGAAISIATTALMVFALKAAIARPRPCAAIPGVAALGFRAPTDFSFPSGHAAGSFAFAAFASTWSLIHERRSRFARLHSVSLMTIASGVAVSRVVLGVHFPSDVAAGALLGAAIGHLTARHTHPSRAHRTPGRPP